MAKTQSVSIKNTLNGKTIFIVGGTGFIGKVWIALLIKTVPDIKKIYVLCRKKGQKSAQTIFTQLYRGNPVFDRLREGRQNSDLPEILNIVEGDVCQEHLGLSQELYTQLQQEVDLVVNFAADLRFDGPLDAMVETNVSGALRVGDFVHTAVQAQLLHISTCFVAGYHTGLVPESLDVAVTPLGKTFDPQTEYAWAQQEISVLRARAASFHDLKSAGRARAHSLGWPNSYTYTKSLAEHLLAQKLPPEKITFFRPSIVESSLSFPFQGWNEDINGTVPLTYLLSQGQPFLIAKPEYYLDIIPVDIVARDLTISAVALLRSEHKPVYQSASSFVNPMSVDRMVKIIRHYFYSKKNSSKFMRHAKIKLGTGFVSASGIFGLESLRRTEKLFCTVGSFTKKHMGQEFGLKRFAHRIQNAAMMMKTYKPFIYDLNYTFETKHISDYAKHMVEKDFWKDPTEISWDDYLTHTHLPGIERWCFPKLKTLFQRNR